MHLFVRLLGLVGQNQLIGLVQSHFFGCIVTKFIADFTSFRATYLEKSKTIYQQGTGPDVVILPESPGLHQAVFELGRRIAQAGFRVHLISFFDYGGKPFQYRAALRCVLKSCIRREFAMFSAHRSSPLTDWVRAFCSDLHRETGNGIGLIGMCLTGNFALGLLAEPWMLAPVLAQPSLPIGQPKGLHVSPEILQKAKRNPDLQVLGLRFSGDIMCPKQRFGSLRKTFPTQFNAIEIDSSIGNPHGISPIAHSVLTKDFVDKAGHPTSLALEKTLRFLTERLY